MKKPLSSWVNLQDVFSANKGEGERMNSQVFGALDQQGAAARQQLSRAEQGFGRELNKANKTFDGIDKNTAAGAEAGGKLGYKGPRQLGDVDPTLNDTFADASRRIGASAQQQLSQQYGGNLTAGGSAFDLALMGAAGGNDQRAKLQAKYAGLGDELRASQTISRANAGSMEDRIREEALRLAGRAPQLRQEEAVARRRREEQAIVDANNKARDNYDRDWNLRNDLLRRRRGNEIQASYQPPESEMLPFYPVS